jgi:hypothetical protein
MKNMSTGVAILSVHLSADINGRSMGEGSTPEPNIRVITNWD